MTAFDLLFFREKSEKELSLRLKRQESVKKEKEEAVNFVWDYLGPEWISFALEVENRAELEYDSFPLTDTLYYKLAKKIQLLTRYFVEMEKALNGSVVDGYLSKTLMVKCFSLVGITVTEEALTNLLQQAGIHPFLHPTDQNKISYPRFLSWLDHEQSLVMSVKDMVMMKNDTFVRAFLSFDRRGAGELTLTEFNMGLHNFGMNIPNIHKLQISQKCDRNGDGVINYMDFILLFYHNSTSFDEEEGKIANTIYELIIGKYRTLYQCFQDWDTHQNCVLKLNELYNGLKSLGFANAEKQIRRIARQAIATNKKGVLGYRDFVAFFTPSPKTLEQHVGELLRAKFENLQNAFQAFRKKGKNKAGLLSTDTFLTEMAKLELNLSHREIATIRYSMHLNHKGYMEFSEFENLFMDSESRLLVTQEKSGRAMIEKYGDLESAFHAFKSTSTQQTLSSNELFFGLKELSANLSEAEITSVVQNVDEDGNDEIDIMEFRKAFRDKQYKFQLFREDIINALHLNWKDPESAFKFFNTSNNGLINIAELRRALHKLALTPSDAELNAVLRGIDEDFSGEIDPDEFQTLFEGNWELPDDSHAHSRPHASVHAPAPPPSAPSRTSITTPVLTKKPSFSLASPKKQLTFMKMNTAFQRGSSATMLPSVNKVAWSAFKAARTALIMKCATENGGNVEEGGKMQLSLADVQSVLRDVHIGMERWQVNSIIARHYLKHRPDMVDVKKLLRDIEHHLKSSNGDPESESDTETDPFPLMAAKPSTTTVAPKPPSPRNYQRRRMASPKEKYLSLSPKFANLTTAFENMNWNKESNAEDLRSKLSHYGYHVTLDEASTIIQQSSPNGKVDINALIQSFEKMWKQRQSLYKPYHPLFTTRYNQAYDAFIKDGSSDNSKTSITNLMLAAHSMLSAKAIEGHRLRNLAAKVSKDLMHKYVTLCAAFQHMDRNSDKEIDENDFEKALTDLGISGSDMEKLFAMGDSRGSGKMTYFDFLRLFTD